MEKVNMKLSNETRGVVDKNCKKEYHIGTQNGVRHPRGHKWIEATSKEDALLKFMMITFKEIYCGGLSITETDKSPTLIDTDKFIEDMRGNRIIQSMDDSESHFSKETRKMELEKLVCA